MAVEVEQWLQENYRGLVASGASRWDIVEAQAEAQGSAALASFARSEAAGDPLVTEPPKGRRSAADKQMEG